MQLKIVLDVLQKNKQSESVTPGWKQSTGQQRRNNISHRPQFPAYGKSTLGVNLTVT